MRSDQAPPINENIISPPLLQLLTHDGGDTNAPKRA